MSEPPRSSFDDDPSTWPDAPTGSPDAEAEERPGRAPLTRRRFLVTAAGSVVGLGVGTALAHRAWESHRLDHVLGRCGTDGKAPTATHAVSRSGTIRSKHLGRPAGWTMAWPTGTTFGTATPVVVCLHGHGNTHAQAFSGLHLPDLVPLLTGPGRARPAGTPVISPFAIAAVDGGDGYWHARAGGEDGHALLVDDFLPLLVDHGLGADGTRTALLGWSMGGAGALMAAEADPARFAAVSVASPAVATTRGGVPDGYDDDADFAAHDPIAHAAELGSLPVQVLAGDRDPFRAGADALLAALERRPGGATTTDGSTASAGCHDAGYWQRVAPQQLRFLGRHLTGPS